MVSAEGEADERVSIARKELQWISAKKQLQLDRLRGHYLDAVAFERIVLHPFGVRRVVSVCFVRPKKQEVRASDGSCLVHCWTDEAIHVDL